MLGSRGYKAQRHVAQCGTIRMHLKCCIPAADTTSTDSILLPLAFTLAFQRSCVVSEGYAAAFITSVSPASLSHDQAAHVDLRLRQFPHPWRCTP